MPHHQSHLPTTLMSRNHTQFYLNVFLIFVAAQFKQM